MKPHDKMMTDLDRLLKTQNFKNEAELQAFLKSMIGQIVPEFEPEALSIAEKAEDLVFEAYDLDTEEAFGNVLEALEMDPDCIAAYEFLGSYQPAPQLALPYYAYGVQIGRKKFSKEIVEDRGLFWGITETRPFMRCLNHTASCFAGIGHFDRSVEIYREILELNEHDNMGVRYSYGLFLLRAGKFDEYTKLDKKFGIESTAMASFNRVMHYFLLERESPATLGMLKKAKAQNKHFIAMLTSKTVSENLPDAYVPESKDEARIYADFAYDVWHEMDGAIEFLSRNRK